MKPSVEKSKKFHQRAFFYLFLSLAISFCSWFIFASLTPSLPQNGDPPCLYSNPSRKDLRQTLLKALQETKSSIHLCMFGLNDPAILRALHQKMENPAITTTLFYDVSASPNIRKLLTKATVYPIQRSGLMHQKILVLDEEKVFIGSANFTTTSLKMHDNLVIGLHSQEIAHFLSQKKPYSSGYLKTIVGGQPVAIWLLPDPEGIALNHLKEKIRGAKRKIQIALFTLTHKELIQELITAHERGVFVKVILDSHSALGASAKAASALKDAKIEVRYSQGVQLMHHKLMYIDEKTLITGSTNWTKAAFQKNADLIIELSDLLPDQKKHMRQLWKRLECNCQN